MRSSISLSLMFFVDFCINLHISRVRLLVIKKGKQTNFFSIYFFIISAALRLRNLEFLFFN